MQLISEKSLCHIRYDSSASLLYKCRCKADPKQFQGRFSADAMQMQNRCKTDAKKKPDVMQMQSEIKVIQIDIFQLQCRCQQYFR
jgi:hypothetical protein